MADPVIPVTPAAPAVVDPAITAALAPPGGPTLLPVEPAVVPAAPAAPVTPVVAPVEFTFEPSGNVGLDLAMGYFGKLGLTLESPEMIEAGKGNFQYLEAKLAAMGDKAKGHEQYLTLGKQALKQINDEANAAFAATEKVVHDAVGGKETWTAVQAFARSVLKPEQLNEVAGVLNAGGIGAEAMASYLHQKALAAQGTTIPGATAVNPAANPGNTVTLSAPLTRQEWRKEYQKLIDAHGIAGLENKPEFAALKARFPAQ